MAENSVGHTNSFVGERELRVKFDSSLIQRERRLRVASEEELGSLSARLECFQGGAERFFQRLIEPGQRFRRLPELLAKARARRSQLMDDLITSANLVPSSAKVAPDPQSSALISR